MNAGRTVFYILAALTLIGAVGVITRKNAVHSAILLIGTLMGVAGLYVVLEAEFLAAVQVLVYAGGVMVLFLFVIMLVDLEQRGRTAPETRRKLSRGAFAAGAVLTGLVIFTLLGVITHNSLGPPPEEAGVLHAEGGNLGAVAMTMFRHYLLPFELASVLLLVAMVGAIVLARPRL